MDREKVIAWITEISLRPCDFARDDFDAYETEHLANEALEICEDAKVFNQQRNDALALLKELEEQKRKWLQTIADTQLAISPTGYESEDELAKRGWEWNGLQIAWEIIAGEERSEHPRLVRCKDCNNRGTSDCPIEELCNGWIPSDDWFCADGERKDT